MPTVAVGDIVMYYEVSGSGEPLLLIPGLATDVTDYARIIPLIAGSYRVIAVDNRGAGRTDKPNKPYSIEQMAADAEGLLAALHIDRAHVLGFSMGGRIAVALALAHPDMVRSLILVSTSVRRRTRASWSTRLVDLSLRVPFLHGSRAHPQPTYAGLRQRDASRTYDASERLAEIHVPTLILHGTVDRTAPLRYAEEMHAGIAGSQLITFRGGHIFFFLRPQPVVDAVTAFLRSQ